MNGKPWARPMSTAKTICDRCGDPTDAWGCVVRLCGPCNVLVRNDPLWHPGGREFETIKAARMAEWNRQAARLNKRINAR